MDALTKKVELYDELLANVIQLCAVLRILDPENPAIAMGEAAIAKAAK